LKIIFKFNYYINLMILISKVVYLSSNKNLILYILTLQFKDIKILAFT
jgi:hypothetical protein